MLPLSLASTTEHWLQSMPAMPTLRGWIGRGVDKAGNGPPCAVVAQVRPALARDQGPLQVHARQARAGVAAALLRRCQQIAGAPVVWSLIMYLVV